MHGTKISADVQVPFAHQWARAPVGKGTCGLGTLVWHTSMPGVHTH